MDHAALALGDDAAVVAAALASNAAALEFASERLSADWATVLAAVARDGAVLEFADASLCDDR